MSARRAGLGAVAEKCCPLAVCGAVLAVVALEDRVQRLTHVLRQSKVYIRAEKTMVGLPRNTFDRGSVRFAL